MDLAAIVLAAGRGERFGRPKQFSTVHGERLVDRAVALATSIADRVVLVLPRGVPWTGQPVAEIAPGGATRMQSLRNAVETLPATTDIVVVHDAIRPLATRALLDSLIAAVKAL